MVDLKKMEVWEEEIVEIFDRGLLVVVEERIFVEDRVRCKIVKVDMTIVEVDMKVVASMSDAMVVY